MTVLGLSMTASQCAHIQTVVIKIKVQRNRDFRCTKLYLRSRRKAAQAVSAVRLETPSFFTVPSAASRIFCPASIRSSISTTIFSWLCLAARSRGEIGFVSSRTSV